MHAGRGEILITEMSTANRKTILVLFNQILSLVSIIILSLRIILTFSWLQEFQCNFVS